MLAYHRTSQHAATLLARTTPLVGVVAHTISHEVRDERTVRSWAQMHGYTAWITGCDSLHANTLVERDNIDTKY